MRTLSYVFVCLLLVSALGISIVLAGDDDKTNNSETQQNKEEEEDVKSKIKKETTSFAFG